jgi:hypothetical protein
MLRSTAASKGQQARKGGELRSPKRESIVSLAETRGFYRPTQPTDAYRTFAYLRPR